MWQRPAGAPKIDLERQRVFPRSAVERPLQRSVGNKSAVPIILPVDFGGCKAGRQRPAGHDMLRSYAIGGGVEIGKVSGTDIHGANAEAHGSGIDPVEIHQPLEGSLQGRSIIVAGLVRAARGPQCRRRHTRSKKIRSAKQEDAHGSSLIDKLMNKSVSKLDGFEIWDAQRRRANGLPKFTKSIDALVRGIAGNDCCIDGADRDSRDPIRMKIRLSQGLIDPSLVGAECSAALEQKDNLLEWRPWVLPGVGSERHVNTLIC